MAQKRKKSLNIPTIKIGIREPVSYLFPCHPMPKKRHRHFSRGKRIISTKDPVGRDYEDKIRSATALQHPEDFPFEGDLVGFMNFFFESRVHGDIDNLAKAVLDGMQDVAFVNDRQFKALHLEIFFFDELPPDEHQERIEVILTHRRAPACFVGDEKASGVEP